MRMWCCYGSVGFRGVVIAGWLAAWLAGCGPQTVPAPRRHYDQAGTAAIGAAGAAVGPIAASGGRAAPTAATGASGAVAPPPSAGRSAPPPTAGWSAPPGNGGTGVVVPPAAGRDAPPVTLPPFDAGNDPARNQVRPGGLCARIAEINCASEQHCCNAPGRTAAACKSALTSSCTNDTYLDQIAMNSVAGFDANATKAALDELETRASQCDLEIASWGISIDGFRGMLKGTIAPGGNCKPANAVTADKPTQAAALLSCTDIATSACLPKQLLGDWTCAPKNAAGGKCATDLNCMDGAYCAVPMGGALGTCKARQALGANCTDGTQCSSLYCKSGKCVSADTQVAYCLQ